MANMLVPLDSDIFCFLSIIQSKVAYSLRADCYLFFMGNTCIPYTMYTARGK